MFEKFEVGTVYPQLKTCREGMQFDIQDSGALLVVHIPSPTKKEIMEIRKGSFEIKSFAFSNVIMLMTKFGSLDWLDAPYTPHLSQNLTGFSPDLALPESGLSLFIVLVDSATGEIKGIRLIGLGHNFSISLVKDTLELWKKHFELRTYNQSVDKIFSGYSTKDLVRLASNRWKC